jgi:hypothetical protein
MSDRFPRCRLLECHQVLFPLPDQIVVSASALDRDIAKTKDSHR